MADDDNNNNNNYNDNYGDGNDDNGGWANFNQKDDRTCKVYDHNDFFTVFVQLLLAAFALGSLYLKRMKEVPRRTFSTWALDVSKQGVGACYAHVCNMVSPSVPHCGVGLPNAFICTGNRSLTQLLVHFTNNINTRPLLPFCPINSTEKPDWKMNAPGMA